MNQRVVHFSIGAVLSAAACLGSIEPTDGSGGTEPSRPPASSPGAGPGPGGGAPPGMATALPALARRLTRDEIVYTVQDVLGVTLSGAEVAAIPSDRPLEGFVNIATSQTASADHVSGYAAVGRAVSARFDAKAFIDRYAACKMPSAACAPDVVSSIGLRLFRRPLDTEEAVAFGGLFKTATDAGVDFIAAARLVVEAMLQSPQFLYRLERETATATKWAAGKPRTVGGYEMASRLSYFLWSSAPDDALYEAAQSASLDDPTGIAQQVERLLLDDVRGRRATRRFLTDWARLDSVPDDGGLRGDLVDSLLGFFDDLVWKRKQSLLDALTAKRAFLTPTLAKGYGLTAAGTGVREYDLSSAPGRAGLLAQPGFVAGMTHSDGPAMVVRGLFLQSQLFCAETPPPPGSLQETITTFLGKQPPTASERQVADARLARADCGPCHSQFDPLAFGFDRFDFQGRYTERDKFGNALEGDGWIPARFTSTSADQKYGTLEEYMALLAKAPGVQGCLVKQFLQFGLGQVLDAPQTPAVQELLGPFIEHGGTYGALIAAIVAHPLFREMRVE